MHIRTKYTFTRIATFIFFFREHSSGSQSGPKKKKEIACNVVFVVVVNAM